MPLPLGLVSNREYAQTLARVLGTMAEDEIPAETLRQYISLAADVTTNMRRVMPQRALELGYPFKFPELEPALRDLVKTPTTLFLPRQEV